MQDAHTRGNTQEAVLFGRALDSHLLPWLGQANPLGGRQEEEDAWLILLLYLHIRDLDGHTPG